MKKLILLLLIGFIGCTQFVTLEEKQSQLDRVFSRKLIKVCFEGKEVILRGCDEDGCSTTAFGFFNLDDDGKPVKCKGANRW